MLCSAAFLPFFLASPGAAATAAPIPIANRPKTMRRVILTSCLSDVVACKPCTMGLDRGVGVGVHTARRPQRRSEDAESQRHAFHICGCRAPDRRCVRSFDIAQLYRNR